MKENHPLEPCDRGPVDVPESNSQSSSSSDSPPPHRLHVGAPPSQPVTSSPQPPSPPPPAPCGGSCGRLKLSNRPPEAASAVACKSRLHKSYGQQHHGDRGAQRDG
ncbi:hypothetical protein NL676_025968 [Syzygium grande]|nr:hypothetical protein NL676_025968 [Syzygium grande]